ncbi:MAG TPA: TCR/Tet family MFS transporter [Gemmatimonadaceae bacterium]|nr:TCR/Tet family MFS transporter [Gemmatimonadaceae bacterium]
MGRSIVDAPGDTGVAAAPAGAPPPSRAAFAFIFVTVALDMLALGIMAPVLPTLIVQFEGGAMAEAARITGLFGFVWAAMQFICAPILGALSDRYGRRPVILLSNFGLGIDYLVMALAPTVWWLFLGRAISGITSSSFPTAGAYVADVTPPDERAARFGMLGAAFGLGFIIGPAVGGVLGGIDLRLPFWVAAGLSLLNAAYGFFILPESLPRERRVRVPWRAANPVGSLKLLRSSPELVGLAAVAFLYYVAHEVLPSLFVLYTQYRYVWSERQIGLALAIIGICSTIVSATLIRPAVKRLGERRALLAGLACMAAGSVVFGLMPTGVLFLVGIPFAALAGLASPAMQALATRRVGATEQGRLQGALSSLRGIAMMLGPVLFTEVFASTLHWGGARGSGIPFVLAALLLVAGAAVAHRVTRARA